MNSAAAIFPGIYFDRVKPALDSVLPRMDIAAFVGFASSGPLHTPVAVEDLARFRDIFGIDVELAWDGERNQIEKSYLGSAVENFFRHGGKRCWIVRVADEQIAQTAQFAIPGLFRTDGTVVEQVMADARSPGSWAELVRLRSRLNVESLQLQHPLGMGSVLNIGSEDWYADLVANIDKIQSGDLITVNMGDDGSQFYLLVDQVVANEQGVRISGSRGFYYFTDVSASPVALDPALAIASIDNSFQLFNLSDFDSLALSAEWPSVSSPNSTDLPSLRLLSFNLRSLESSGQTKEIETLKFSSDHPRFWGFLPDDDHVFSQTDGKISQKIPPETQNLIQQALSPRFPVAATEDAGSFVYLPLAMQIVSAESSRAEFSSSASTPLRNGLSNFGSSYFLDSRLTSLGVDLLAREANRLVYLMDVPSKLRGVHSFLTLKEATLISVPDAIHRRWDDVPPGFELPLAAPELHSIDMSEDLLHTYHIQWSLVGAARWYTLEWSTDPDFVSGEQVRVTSDDLPQIGEAVDLLPAPETEYFLKLDHGCPQAFYFRVRAEREAEVSAWSNHRALVIPEVDFTQCSTVQAQSLELAFTVVIGGSPASSPEVEGHYLSWTLTNPASELAAVDAYEIQRADEFNFLNPTILFAGEADKLGDALAPDFFVEAEPDSTFYYRLRAFDKATIGPWSNTITLWPSQLSQMTLQDKSDYSDLDLLAIHRALLRICAARGDLFGVLSVARHYQTQAVIDHCAALKPSSDRLASLSTVSDSLTAYVPALNVGEKNATSHGAMYFPWLASRVESGSGVALDVIYGPPDGVVLGKIAGSAIAQGAWIAPANSPFEDVLALDKDITRQQWQQLMQARVNVVRVDSRGYLLLSADTLSSDIEFNEINVRRLMSMIRRIAEREGNRYVFENNNELLHDKVKQQFEKLFSRLFARGAFAGANTTQAYRVVTGSEVNTSRSIDAGRFVVELHVAPSRALKFIRVRLVQEGDGKIQVQELSA